MTTRERPIIFDSKSVEAILAGNKTQTRRVVKPQPVPAGDMCYSVDKVFFPNIKDELEMAYARIQFPDNIADVIETSERCPYGYADADGTCDRLWVREVWTRFMDGIAYRADTTPFSEEQRKAYGVHWNSPIHMPCRASRITLVVTDVRVERVQAITAGDAKAEGIDAMKFPHEWLPAFAERWDSINAKRGYSWMMNPWVWVVEFKVI